MLPVIEDSQQVKVHAREYRCLLLHAVRRVYTASYTIPRYPLLP